MTNDTTPSGSLLIRGATVLSVDPRIGDLECGDILLSADTIAAVGPDLSAIAGAAPVLDASGMIAIPGFVDAHVHAWEGQLRGIAPVTDFGGYLRVTAFGYGPRYRPQDVYAGTLLSALTALDAGITTVVDNAHLALTPDHAVAAVEALVDAGVRGVHAIGAPFGSDLEHVPTTALALRDRFAGPLLDVRLFEVDPSPDRWRFARDEGLWVSTELGPHTAGLDAVMADLDARGLLTPEHAFNHCYDLSEEVWRRIGASGAAVNLCPRSDAAFGLGSTVPPVRQALTSAAAVGLSGDNEVSYGLNMFAEMQALLLRDRAEGFRRLALGGAAPSAGQVDALTPGRLLELATVGGAANAGLGGRVGSLTPGLEADLVLLRADDLNTTSAADPTTTVTALAHPGNVDTVIVAGVVRKHRGRLVGVDRAVVGDLVRRSRRHVLGHGSPGLAQRR